MGKYLQRQRIVFEGHCVFGERCAYNHTRRSNSQINEKDTLLEDVKNLRYEVDNLKNVMKDIIDIRVESENVKVSIKDIKEEIQLLTASNLELVDRLKYLEEDLFEDESDDENESNVEFNLVKPVSNKEKQKHANKFKCSQCDYISKTDMSLKKHVNTKHPLQNTQYIKKGKSHSKSEDFVFDGIDDLFQIEILEGEQVYACNVCDQGFDRDEEIRTHIEIDHKEIILQISENIDKEKESKVTDNSDESSGEESIMNDSELYAGFDEDGNRIVEDDHNV